LLTNLETRITTLSKQEIQSGIEKAKGRMVSLEESRDVYVEKMCQVEQIIKDEQKHLENLVAQLCEIEEQERLQNDE
jgi:hypothetical protein